MIEQPSSVPTSVQIQKATEAARNNVTLLEAESQRLERVIGSQKREIIVHEGTKKELDDQIEVVEGKLSILDTQINEAEKKLASLTEQNQKKAVELTAREEAINLANLDLDSREAAISGKESKLAEAEKDLEYKVNTFEEMKDRHYVAIERIKKELINL